MLLTPVRRYAGVYLAYRKRSYVSMFNLRILSLARDYSQKRKVFGRYQSEWPLHVSTLAKVEIEARACLALLLEAARLLGRQVTRACSFTLLIL